MQLNYNRLNGEYINWSLNNGDGENKDGLSFGQYIHKNYNMTHFRSVVSGIKSCEEAYSLLLKELYIKEVK